MPPISEKIRKQLQKPGTVFLDTARVCNEEMRSFLFSDPVETITAHSPGDVTHVHERIENALKRGFYVAGYWCYEWGYALIPKLRHLLEKKTPPSPLLWLGIYERPDVWIEKRVNSNERALFDNGAFQNDPSPLITSVELDTDRQQFTRAVNRIKEYISSGDTYQVNYTIRSRFSLLGDPLDLYQRLRALQEVSYAAVIHTGGSSTDDRWILSLSPELFFHRQGELIWSKPMKGTVSRGASPEEDRRLAEFLKNDIKNQAENVMIVDLLRNDMGRIAEMGSVKVPELFHVERYETLFQMISRIEARLKKGTGWKRIFEALFPCGSITGAPKIRTMEIISRLETSPRGVYTGSIGYLSPDNRAVLNVAIRTVEIKGGEGIMGTGSGITFSSDPESEYLETKLKTKFLEQAAHNHSRVN